MRAPRSIDPTRTRPRAEGVPATTAGQRIDALGGAPSADVAGLGVKLHAVSKSQLRHIEHALYLRQEKETLDRIIQSLGD